jgi:hypothetical protein
MALAANGNKEDIIDTTATPITTIGPDACTAIEESILPAMEAAAAALGLTVTASGGTYGVGSAKLAFTFTVADGERLEFERHASSLGLVPGDFGREWTDERGKWEITGVAPKSRRFPVLGTLNGRPMKLEVGGLPFGRYSEVTP